MALEAKIITPNGLVLPVFTEWIITKDGAIVLDCELNAIKRLCANLKRNLPKRDICLVLDELYPREPLFSICEIYNCKYLSVLRNDCLKTLWKEINIIKSAVND